MSAEGRGLAAAIAAGALWGAIGIFNKWLFAYGLDPLTVVTIRVALAWVAFGLIILVTERRLFVIRRRDLPLLGAAGVLSVAAFSFLYSLTVQQSSVATAVVLQFMAPVYVVFISALVFKERVTAPKLVALVLALLGAVLSVGGFSRGALLITPLGLAAGIGAGLTYALYSLFGKAAAGRYAPWTVLFYTYGFGGLALLALWLPTHPGGVADPRRSGHFGGGGRRLARRAGAAGGRGRAGQPADRCAAARDSCGERGLGRTERAIEHRRRCG